MTKPLGSWGPTILGLLECLEVVSPLGTMELTAEFQTNVVQSFPEGTRTTGWGRGGSCVPAPVGSRHSQLCWNRCCIPLTSDPKILGMLGCLGNGESFGTLGIFAKLESKVALHWLRLEGSPNVSFSNCHSTYNISSAVCPFGELRKPSIVMTCPIFSSTAN